ncbi:adenylyltransferase/cytidyltransferase family protein [Candidatus Saccharibacteria bacterium]|nr:adenylyltransferase/cytidyltransferase family protein [Candidatus Saccharibacteria bacterium]
MIVQVENLSEIRSRYQDKKIVLTSGTFDLLHVGHLRYLSAVNALGDIVIIMLSGDKRVEARKGPKRPIIPEQDRAQMLDALEVVDYVFIDPATKLSDEEDPVHNEIVVQLQPDVYASDGPDPRFWSIMDESKLVILPRSEGDDHASTSAIIEHIVSMKH